VAASRFRAATKINQCVLVQNVFGHTKCMFSSKKKAPFLFVDSNTGDFKKFGTERIILL
jgi:hypothetical protein